MLPDPLHPAIVHLPIALAVLVPLLALAGVLGIRQRLLPVRAWAAIVVLQALLVGSAWMAVETGEREEERAERVVAERHIEAHQAAAERFLLLAGVGLLVFAAGLMPGTAGTAGRIASTLAAFLILAAGVSVGHSGGELVYKHGAATAYLDRPGVAAARLPTHDDDDD